ncbi:MAG: M48 family metallopeptidase [Burkholderiales bacterium]
MVYVVEDPVQSLPYGEEKIRYLVRIQTGRKSSRVAIHVESDGRVLVDAPAHASARDIRVAVAKQARWISTHVKAAGQRRANVRQREYVSGESWLYLGRRYRLKVATDIDQSASVRLNGQYLSVVVPHRSEDTIRNALEAWYLRRAKIVLANRVAEMSSSLRWIEASPPLRVRSMKIQWGSCSPAGLLTLNPHLVKASRQCIDYVVLHELCHVKIHNHSAAFYRLLDRHLPGWRSIKARLDSQAEEILQA